MGVGRLRSLWVTGILVALLAWLTILVRAHPNNAVDRVVLDWIAGWDAPGLDRIMEACSVFTDLFWRLGIGLAAVGYLYARGYTSRATSIVAASIVVIIPAVAIDYALGLWVQRDRPIPVSGSLSYPSGHVMGSVAEFGFIAVLAIRRRIRWSLLGPLLALLAVPIVVSGPARIFLLGHWPTDIAAGLLMGTIALIALVWIQQRFETRLLVRSETRR